MIYVYASGDMEYSNIDRVQCNEHTVGVKWKEAVQAEVLCKIFMVNQCAKSGWAHSGANDAKSLFLINRMSHIWPHVCVLFMVYSKYRVPKKWIMKMTIYTHFIAYDSWCLRLMWWYWNAV